MGSQYETRTTFVECQLTSLFECCLEGGGVGFDFASVLDLVWFCHVNLYRSPRYSHPIIVDH